MQFGFYEDGFRWNRNCSIKPPTAELIFATLQVTTLIDIFQSETVYLFGGNPSEWVDGLLAMGISRDTYRVYLK
jgi:hypothetical protein